MQAKTEQNDTGGVAIVAPPQNVKPHGLDVAPQVGAAAAAGGVDGAAGGLGGAGVAGCGAAGGLGGVGAVAGGGAAGVDGAGAGGAPASAGGSTLAPVHVTNPCGVDAQCVPPFVKVGVLVDLRGRARCPGACRPFRSDRHTHTRPARPCCRQVAPSKRRTRTRTSGPGPARIAAGSAQTGSAQIPARAPPKRTEVRRTGLA
jgi:hypothetical protein